MPPREEDPAGPQRSSVSVVICTYTERRWWECVAAVRSVVGQLRAGDDCLVVVDHNDDLRRRASAAFADVAVVRVLASDHPPGLSGARNCGVAHSRGQVVAFLDDDATATTTWLDECLAPFTEPAVLVVGAAARPAWPDGGRPGWFPAEFDWVVGCSYRGLPDRQAAVRNVIGAAMAFRRRVFDVAGGFDPTVGRVGASPLGCEETELCIRLRQAEPAARIVYRPSAVVHHRIPANRTTPGYFLHRCFAEGVSKARVARLVGREDGLASERAYLHRTLPRAVLRELARASRGQLSGLAATTMIVAGVTAAALGYLRRPARSAAGPSIRPTRERADVS